MLRLLRYLRGRFEIAYQSDTEFIEDAYLEILGRPADADGLAHYRALLRQGLGRTAVLLSLMRSEEFRRTLAPSPVSTLPDLRVLRPDSYAIQRDLTNGEQILTFDAASPSDFDWLEHAILEHGYYEKPGVWNLGVDTDKKVIAEMIAAFSPDTALELGCAAGAVLECLEDHGVSAEGVEISAMAMNRASDRVRARIHHGDLLALALPSPYDIVFGLDVFEHLNPNRLTAYLARITDLTRRGGYVFCNIPALGNDPVFGTVFPLYLEAWQHQQTAGPFTTIHTDERGYPVHGHLTWASAAWWVDQFGLHGLQREEEIERAFHQKYDRYMEKRSPARKAFFVFSKESIPDRSAAILRRIAGSSGRGLSAEDLPEGQTRREVSSTR